MKVVLFCGGLGMRLREYAGNVPKPLVLIGNRPIIWYLMKYYAHFGHKDFVLCLGHQGTAIKQYFLNYEEYTSNDFILSEGGRTRELLGRDLENWRITFVDTGLDASIGERLWRVRSHLDGEDVFLANYADGLTDLHLPDQIEHLEREGRVASFLSVKPNISYHFVETDDGGTVTGIHDIIESGLRVNGGFFVLRREIFDYMREGEDLVNGPFQRLIDDEQLLAYRYDGYWQAIDTAKDKERVDHLHATGEPPWELWRGLHDPERGG
jgi:glucose-1-phosphate cytidylyltransferase